MADRPSFYAETSLGTLLIDRGEQLAEEVNETVLGVEASLGSGILFADVYRITPLGAQDDLYTEEVDFTLGYAMDLAGNGLTLGGSWLTYPGSEDTESLELFGELGLAAPFEPIFAAFYDTEFEDFGLEATAGSSTEISGTTVYAIARIGAVEPGEGEGWTYYGTEFGAERELAGGLGAYARLRLEQSSEDTLFRSNGSQALSADNNGVAFTLGLTYAR
ncbi:MAG: hypothetical protein MRY64_02625 [Hyphomonadaceae bacterium]|nr:hypothetical protein [Hyphomonadaceae bacterium]